jgi:hypothetical protein
MAVQRFRTIEEMNDAPIIAASGDGFERFIRHCARFWAVSPRSYPQGVFRFHTLDEAQAARARISEQRMAETGSHPAMPQDGGSSARRRR